MPLLVYGLCLWKYVMHSRLDLFLYDAVSEEQYWTKVAPTIDRVHISPSFSLFLSLVPPPSPSPPLSFLLSKTAT